MKNHLRLLTGLLFLAPNLVSAKCNTGAIEYVNETGFGISFGGGSSSSFEQQQSINIPMTINGEAACYRKKTSLKFNSEENKKGNFRNILITPMDIEFENVPEAHVKQYIYVETDPTNKALTKFHSMRFICSGNIPLSVEAVSDKYLKILSDEQASVQVATVFATGIAAQNLNQGKKAKSNNQETFDFFAKLYKNKTQRAIEEAPKCEYNIPSVFSETTISALTDVHREIASNYTTMETKVVNGCTKDFSEAMANYQLENFKDNESLKDFKVKKKAFSKKILMEWKE